MSTTIAEAKLTPRQLDILHWILSFTDIHGYPPTFRQVGCHYGWRSPNAMVTHLKSLERKGVVTRVAGQARTLRLTPLGMKMIGGAA
jgi:repressor LexA